MASNLELKAPKSELLIKSFDKTVTLLTGPNEVTLIAHKEVLCRASPIFQTHFKPEWSKQGEFVIKLPNDNPDVICVILYWIYHHYICIPIQYGESYTHDGCGYELMAKVFVTAEKYQMPLLQNDAMDALWQLYWVEEEDFPPGLINYAYEHTLDGSLLRKMIVGALIWKNDPKSIAEKTQYSGVNSEFKQELFNRLWQGLQDVKDGKPKGSFCGEYHEHEDRSSEDFSLCTKLKDYTHVADDYD